MCVLVIKCIPVLVKMVILNYFEYAWVLSIRLYICEFPICLYSTTDVSRYLVFCWRKLSFWWSCRSLFAIMAYCHFRKPTRTWTLMNRSSRLPSQSLPPQLPWWRPHQLPKENWLHRARCVGFNLIPGINWSSNLSSHCRRCPARHNVYGYVLTAILFCRLVK